MVETTHRTQQLSHAHVLAKHDTILYMHVHNIKILFLFEVWNFWVSRPVKQLIKLKWPNAFQVLFWVKFIGRLFF